MASQISSINKNLVKISLGIGIHHANDVDKYLNLQTITFFTVPRPVHLGSSQFYFQIQSADNSLITLTYNTEADCNTDVQFLISCMAAF